VVPVSFCRDIVSEKDQLSILGFVSDFLTHAKQVIFILACGKLGHYFQNA